MSQSDACRRYIRTSKICPPVNHHCTFYIFFNFLELCWNDLFLWVVCDLQYEIYRPAPMAHSYRLGLVIWRYQVRIPVGPDICHRGCAYTVLQTVQRPGVYSAAYGTVHYKEPLKSFEIRVGHSPGFGLPSVAILP